MIDCLKTNAVGEKDFPRLVSGKSSGIRETQECGDMENWTMESWRVVRNVDIVQVFNGICNLMLQTYVIHHARFHVSQNKSK